MTKSKDIKKIIVEKYIDFVLENDRTPESVYKFSKIAKIEESDFYSHFGSFETIEQDIFKSFFDNSLALLSESDEYVNFEPKEKLLSFYFTFFEILTANRSYVVYALKNNSLKNVSKLLPLRKSFLEFIESLGIEKIDVKNENINKAQQKGINESAWLQLLIILKFWLDDTSPSFEKTDIFIEKSITTSFDVFDIKPIKSIIDLGKFILKEKVNLSI